MSVPTKAHQPTLVWDSFTYDADDHGCSFDVRTGKVLDRYSVRSVGGREFTVVKFGGEEYTVRLCPEGKWLDTCTCPHGKRTPFCRHERMVRLVVDNGWIAVKPVGK